MSADKTDPAATEFDEIWYLTKYPDVAKAVRDGKVKSGFDHYRFHGKAEKREPLPPKTARPAVPGLNAGAKSAPMKKSEIINLLAGKYGYKSHLEISTPTTGLQYQLIDRTRYTRCERVVYGLADGEAIDQQYTFRTSKQHSCDMVEQLSKGQPYDLVFVDPYHSYQNSFEDIIGGFSLVRPGGALIVHDCNPGSRHLVSPKHTSGAWCGVTYWAYINFVLGRSGIDYYTVDTDYGCGIIFKRKGPPADTARLEFEWAKASWDDESRYDFFDKNRARLLNLISVDEFKARERASPVSGFFRRTFLS